MSSEIRAVRRVPECKLIGSSSKKFVIKLNNRFYTMEVVGNLAQAACADNSGAQVLHPVSRTEMFSSIHTSTAIYLCTFRGSSEIFEGGCITQMSLRGGSAYFECILEKPIQSAKNWYAFARINNTPRVIGIIYSTLASKIHQGLFISAEAIGEQGQPSLVDKAFKKCQRSLYTANRLKSPAPNRITVKLPNENVVLYSEKNKFYLSTVGASTPTSTALPDSELFSKVRLGTAIDLLKVHDTTVQRLTAIITKVFIASCGMFFECTTPPAIKPHLDLQHSFAAITDLKGRRTIIGVINLRPARSNTYQGLVLFSRFLSRFRPVNTNNSPLESIPIELCPVRLTLALEQKSRSTEIQKLQGQNQELKKKNRTYVQKMSVEKVDAPATDNMPAAQNLRSKFQGLCVTPVPVDDGKKENSKKPMCIENSSLLQKN